MADRAFIDADLRNRGARGGSSEGANETRQSIRNNQVITGGGKTTRPPAPLTRPTPPPTPPATDTSAPGNAAANIAAAISTRPSPPVVVASPPPIVVTPPPPPVFIPPSIPDVQATPQTFGAPPQNTEVLDIPAPVESLPLGPVDIEILTESSSGGDEIPPPFPPRPDVPSPGKVDINAAIAAGIDPTSIIDTVGTPPPIEEVIEEIIEQTLQTPKEEPTIPVQSTVQVPEPKPSTPVVAPPRPKIKKSTDVPKPKPGYITKPNGFIKKPPEPVVNVPRPPKQSGPGSPTKPGGLAATLVGTGKPKVTAPSDDAGAVVGPQVSEPKPAVGTPGPKFKGSDTIVRPDGVTEVLGPGGVVLEEIGLNGQIISDPIKDAGFDPKDPPASIQALRDEFAEHVESGADEAGEVFYVSEETKEELINDGLGDVGGALTVQDQVEKLEKLAPNGDVSNLPSGFAVLQNDLVKKGVIKASSEVTTKGTKGTKKAIEKVVKQPVAQAQLTPRDYLATIEEVLDNNRIRVSLSYNDGVNLYKHKGEDQVANKFKGFRVNYVKNNIERYKTYVKVGNQYYLVTNSKLGIDGKQRTIKVKQPLTDDVNVGEKFTFVEKRLPNYRDRVRLEPFQETPDEGIFLRLPNLNSVDNPINFQGTNYGTHTSLTSENDNDTRDIERILISGSLLDVQPNIDYQKTTTDLSIEADDTGFGNFVHFSNAETRLYNFKEKLESIETLNSQSSSLLTITSSLSRIQSIEAERQGVINSFDPFENFMYFESSSYVSSSDGQFHDTSLA